MSNAGIPKKTPLYNYHLNAKARMVDFAGWLLPVQYTGILKEHLHTRQFNSIFDICHMGEFLIEGKTAYEDISRIHTADSYSMQNGACRYGFILNKTGKIIDDSILYKYSDEKFMLVVNAGRIQEDFKWISTHISAETNLNNISSHTAKIDLQGPLSEQTAINAFPGFDFRSLKRFCFETFIYNDIPVTVSATGYTGEKGYEFFVPDHSAGLIWESLSNIDSVQPAGLGARDSLRLEKGYPLYGHDLTDKITPFEANLGRFISLDRNFIGRDALEVISNDKTGSILVPFICEGRRAARDGYKVYCKDEPTGQVTSGVFSPVLERGIGLCMLKTSQAFAGNKIICKNDNIEIQAEVCSLPFV